MLHLCNKGSPIKIQKDYLIKYECDKLQGYLFSKPVSEEEAIKVLYETNG